MSNEDGQYKIVASKDDLTEVGTAALYLLRHGDEAGARSLLDWKRELMHRGGEATINWTGRCFRDSGRRVRVRVRHRSRWRRLLC